MLNVNVNTYQRESSDCSDVAIVASVVRRFMIFLPVGLDRLPVAARAVRNDRT
jgi:hypothetical protein